MRTITDGGTKAEPGARHVYETKGSYTLHGESIWEATFTMTGPGIAVPLPIDAAIAHIGTAHEYRVVEIRPTLTR